MSIWAAVISAAVVVIVQGMTTAYLSGKVVGKIEALDGRMSRNEDADKSQWQAINDHETRLSKLQGRLE